MADIETRLFRHFVVLAEEQHFSRAALRLKISPPTLTHQIKKLESQLGTKLVERKGEPSEFGWRCCLTKALLSSYPKWTPRSLQPVLITAPNLLRAGQRHGFLENIVTHPGFRGQGHGRAVVHGALSAAWAKDCYHVLLQSGRKDPRVHRFYQRCGFEPGLRVGYVAHRPAK